MVKKAREAIPNTLLRRARQARGWTQKEVADAIGAPSPLNVTRWERGATWPSAFYQAKLCQLFAKSREQLGFQKLEAEADANEDSPVVTPAPWMVPYRRNLFFTGRGDVLTLLADLFLRELGAVPVRTYALSGLGGIGKTQLALEYAHRHRGNYRAIFWLRAASQDTMQADFAAMADLLDLPERQQPNQEKVVQAVKRWLNQNHGWLLILDNADDLAVLSAFLPEAGEGHLLLTTRAAATGTIALNIPVEKLSQEEGALLVLCRSKLLPVGGGLEAVEERTREQALHLARTLDGLPLALDQAGAYLEESGCSLATYLELYQSRQEMLLKRRSHTPTDYPYSVASTWSLAFQQVEQTSSLAADLLRLCAFLAPDAIPQSMLRAAMASPVFTRDAGEPDALVVEEAIQVLRHFSLVRRDPDRQTLTIHRLVQAVLRDQMGAQLRRQWAEQAVRAVYAAFPGVHYETYPECQRCLPHAIACVPLIEAYGLAFPEVVQLLDRAASYMNDLALYSQSIPLFQRALRLCEQIHGHEHPVTATLLDHLALTYQERGQYDEADLLYQRALEIRERVLGPEHPDTATTYFDLDWLYYLQGKYQQAEEAAERALEIRERVLGPGDGDTIDVLGDLGMIYITLEKYEQAEAVLMRALTSYERLFGPNYQALGDPLNQLGVLHLKLGNHEQAEQFFKRGIALEQQMHPGGHPSIFRLTDNLGTVYEQRGDFQQAEVYYRQALAYFERNLGPEHPDALTASSRLAWIFHLQGKDELAEQRFLHIIKVREETQGLEHMNLAPLLYRLASIYMQQDRYEEAEPLLQRAMFMQERGLGAEHSDTQATRRLYLQLLERKEGGQAREQASKQESKQVTPPRATPSSAN